MNELTISIPKRIVIKVGTNVLTTEDKELDISVIENISKQIAVLKHAGMEVILVTSGAVGAGKTKYTLKNKKSEAVTRQVYSSIGQVRLMTLYSDFFETYGLLCAQILATKEDFIGKDHYENMQNCFQGLLLDDIIPIVNENDVVSLQELMFTDNDELAGLTAFMIKADALLILSNINGFYDGNPKDAGTSVIKEVRLNDESVEKFIQDEKSSGGRGGMTSKIDTAKRCAEKGIVTYLGNGKQENIISDLFLKNEFEGTTFLVD